MLRKSLIGFGLATTVAMIGLFTPVLAQSQQSISIPVSTVIRNIGVGQTKQLASKPVDQNMVGMVCEVVAVGENQSSVHPGNDLVIASGSDSVVLQNVERAPGVTTETNGQLVLGETITVTLKMGQDDVFSGGMDLEVTCEEPTQVSGDVSFVDECEVENDSFTVVETQGVSYDVDDQRDDNGVGTVTVTATADEGYEITGDSEWTFEFTSEPCEVPTEQVCRDGEVITINEGERLDTDTDADSEECQDGEGQILSTSTERPAQIANTGVGAAAASVLGSTSVFAGLKSWLNSRKQIEDVLSKR